jgi:hypothetical protein
MMDFVSFVMGKSFSWMDDDVDDSDKIEDDEDREILDDRLANVLVPIIL